MDRSTVLLRDFLSNRQTETGPRWLAFLRLPPVKTFKHVREIILVNSLAVVFYLEPCFIFLLPQSHANLRPLSRITNPIVQQDVHQLSPMVRGNSRFYGGSGGIPSEGTVCHL